MRLRLSKLLQDLRPADVDYETTESWLATFVVLGLFGVALVAAAIVHIWLHP